eukprot:TRINITY_DN60921_c0_g1_i1.p1 TRINITY_DN60921_c0_g1~~TRINITY_DN60921_c0_g1_i1.p1  ORF type:complete len:805 (-),score=167.04 TRINITY_DN60921_c0_g1_i1:73-2487(-)
MIGYIFVGLLVWTLFTSALQFYNAFHAPRCPPESRISACYCPLFELDEHVDIFVYLTSSASVEWWTPSGLQQLRGLLLLNTSVGYGQAMKALQVTVPLSDERLEGVRRNKSSLHAHCYLVRAGARLEDEIEASLRAGIGAQSERRSSVISDNVLHASGKLTKRMPQVRKSRRNLLGNATQTAKNSSEIEGADGQTNDVQESPVLLQVPYTSWVFPLYPNAALLWAGSGLAISAFFQPNIYSAALRHGLLAVVMPALIHARRQQDAKAQKAQVSLKDMLLDKPAPAVPHLVPLLRIALGADFEAYDDRYARPLLYKEFVYEKGQPMPVGERDVRYDVLTKDGSKMYVTPFEIDTYGFSSRLWTPLDSNASRPDPALSVEVDVTGMVKYSVVRTMRETMNMYMQMGFTERDLEDVKEFLFRHPLHILVIMQVIGFTQMTLKTLAFKNDISFFRGRSDYTGLSSRSLATDTLQEIIIFAYLFDFDEISRIVLFQVGVSAAISAWKYARVARLGLKWAYFLPWAAYGRGAALEDDADREKATEEIDARGMRYLKFVLYPLSACWGLYNLYHYSYKSWWSWLVSSMADFAYTFGFINLMPQIFINYKLKSVAHMPWRVLMYKFFDTFIDDVFAFFIMSDYMTKKHRFMTLRDDIVFFIFLYQRHIYKVDKSRPDEFGFVYEDEGTEEKKQDSKELEERSKEQEKIKADESDKKCQQSASEEFTITITKKADVRWGMVLDRSDQETLCVKSISPDDGAVAEFNLANPKQAIKPGDVIIRVNKVSGGPEAAQSMLEELKKDGEVSLTLRRA